MRHVPLLVLGTGIDGLATALALAHQGFPVHVLDRGPDPRAGAASEGSGVLMPEAVRELAALGLHDRLRDAAVEVTRMVHLDAVTGRPVREVDLGPPVRERFGFPVLATAPGDLRLALAESCAADEMIEVDYGVTPTTVDDVVDAALVGAPEGPTHRAEALVAADGADSPVRALLGDGARLGAPFTLHAAPGPASGDPVLRMWSSPALHAAGPPSGGTWLVARTDLGRDELHRALDHHLPELRDAVAGSLDAPGAGHVAGHHRPLARWSRHRITVLGDAAQPLLPHGGHGVVQTLLDAAALARAFDRCDGRVLESFDLYARLRAPARLRAAEAVAEYAGLCHAAGLTRRLRDRLWSERPRDPLAEVLGAA